MEFLCLMVVVVAVLAVLGHGIWFITAALLKALLGNSSEITSAPPDTRFARRETRVCPACSTTAASWEQSCSSCGLVLHGQHFRRLVDLRTAENEVKVLAETGMLDAETTELVTQQILRQIRNFVEHPTSPVLSPVMPVEPLPIPDATEVPEAVVPDPVEVPDLLDDPTPPEPVAPTPAAPRPGFLAGFMEERNIVWGELVGGLLIVGCSIALVVTLWKSLESLPYFPFLLVAGINTALFAAGKYSLHHWKLETTSRGLLIISLLLTPLNLLVLATPGLHAASGWLDVLIKGAALLFAIGLVRNTGRDLMDASSVHGPGNGTWMLCLAVVGAPATLLLPAGWTSAGITSVSAWLPLACSMTACGVALLGRQRQAPIEPVCVRAITSVMVFVGLSVFALFAAWGLLLARAADLSMALQGLAIPLAISGIPILEAGLIVHWLTRRLESPTAPSDGLQQVAGTAIALMALLVMTSSVAVAWPDPAAVLSVSAIVGLVFSRAAYRESLPAFQSIAIPSLAVTAVLGFLGAAGRWAVAEGSDPGVWMFQNLGAIECGIALAGFTLALLLGAEILVRLKQQAQAVSYAIGAVGTGTIALLLVSLHGLTNPRIAAAITVAFSVGALASNFRWRRMAVAQMGVWLLVPAALWWLWDLAGDARAIWGTVLACEALAFATIALVLRRSVQRGPLSLSITLLCRAFRDTAIAAGVLAGILDGFAPAFPLGEAHGITAFVLAATAFGLARLFREPQMTWIGSILGLLGLTHLACITLEVRPMTAALILALLAHASLALMAASQFRGRRWASLFADPLRHSALLTSCLSVFLLLVPASGFAPHWAGFAVWLAIVWLIFALVWKEAGAFTSFQAALSLAAVFGGLAWVESQPWLSNSTLRFLDPRALQAYGISLSLLGLAWVFARRMLRSRTGARDLWLGHRLAFDRLVLGGLVIGQFLLTALAIVPAVHAELIPMGVSLSFLPLPENIHAWSSGGWFLVALLAVVLLASLRFNSAALDCDDESILGLLVLLLTSVVLWAGSHSESLAAASALRWGLAIVFLVGSAVVAGRDSLRSLARILGFAVSTRQAAFGARVLLAMAACVVLLLTFDLAATGLSGQRPSGPTLGSIFVRMGWTASVLVPAALLIVGLMGTALRERSPGYAFAGGLIFTATTAMAYALGIITAGGSLDPTRQMWIALLSVGSAAAWALIWLSLERRVTGGPLLTTQVLLAPVGLMALALVPLIHLLANPGQPLEPSIGLFGEVGGLVLLATFAAGYWHTRRVAPKFRMDVIRITVVAAAVLLSFASSAWDSPGAWLPYHVLQAGLAVVGLAFATAYLRDKSTAAPYWSEAIALALAGLSLRAGPTDPDRPWYPVAVALAASLLFGVTALRTRNEWRITASGLSMTLAALLFWVVGEPRTGTGFALAAAIGLAAATSLWSAISRSWNDGGTSRISFTHLAGIVSLVLLALGISPVVPGFHPDSRVLTWSATGAVSVAMLLSLRRNAFAPAGLYILGCIVTVLALGERESLPVWEGWSAPLAMAAYTLLASFLTSMSMSRSGRIGKGPWDWLVPAQGAVAALVVALSLKIGLMESQLSARFVGPFSVLLLVPAAILLALFAPRIWAERLRPSSFTLGAFSVGLLGWSVSDPGGSHVWLERNAWLFTALTLTSFAYLELFPRLPRNTDWTIAGRRIGGWVAMTTLAVLVIELVQQILAFDAVSRRTPLTWPVVISVLAAIAMLIGLALRLALRPDRDPLTLPDRRRTVYVYLAEILFVLLFIHLRLNAPEIFVGQAARYWTFMVMFVAFVGVGLAELFEARGLQVLASPLRRTGLLLPLVPLLAFWAKPPGALLEFVEGHAPGARPMLGYLEKLPQHFDVYASLWFLAGFLYSLMALSRKSFGWAIVAALSANAGLWALLAHSGVPVVLHPQAWAIPLALIVLASEAINRRQLQPDVANGLRYLGIGIIYLSSTADMFIAGVGNSAWLPVILAMLCVAGILAGVMFRVRAFLFLGSGFLLLDVFAMIWHAAVDQAQTWIWYVSGIVLGAAILGLFAVFEKRRNDVLAVVERVRLWN